jgi:glycosyltransferase involved in cell wall biosynthesis
VVTRGGVDLSRFRRRRPPDPAWRARHGIPAQSLLFGAAGRLVQEKAYEVFIRAASRVPKERDVHFAIAGSGPLKEFLGGEIARAGLADRFHLVGLTDDVPHFLGQLDVFVLSSRFEGFPIALLEALAAGLPAIATSVGGVPEMLGRDGGLIVARESEGELAAAFEKMLDPAARRAFAGRAQALAERFSIERSAENFTRLYARLLRRAENAKEGRPS